MITRQTHVTGLTLFLLGVLGFAYDYSDLEALGAACDGRDSCESPKMSDDFFQRNCECDSRCGTYGDCCIDALTSRPSSNRLLKCIPFGTKPNLGAYVISACPRRTPNRDCLRDDMTDPLVAAPVSAPDGPTYRNAHCAACNGADLAKLVSWTPLINCETLASYNLSGDEVWSGLKREGGDWGLSFRGQFHRCTVLFDKPETVKNVRMCRADVVSTCPDGWRRGVVRSRCEAYTAVVHTVDESFRNPHCALCNGVSPDELYCDRDELLSARLKFSFALLFDVDTSGGDIVGVSQEGSCPKNKKYDPFSKKCRKLVCAVPGYKIVGNECQPS